MSLGQLFRLSLLFISRPLLIVPTLQATKHTMKICDSLYGTTHHKSNKANAFRHALWNFLICQKTIKIVKNSAKSIIWTQKVTNLYEKVTKNEILDEIMDLHNNAIGRNVFLFKKEQNEAEIVDFLQEMLKNAKKITKINEIPTTENQLVYILE